MIREKLGKELLFFDGGMGTLLQAKGLLPGELPEICNLEHVEAVVEIHRKYFEAGSDIILTNTFGANALKFHSREYGLKEIVTAAIENARKGAEQGVRDGREVYVALDIGPTGKLLQPMGDHYRTRLTHTLEVSQNARTIAKALRLNEDLVEAIALGHDLGHTPFGHAGERALNEVCELGFRHNEQSVRVVEVLEKQGKGLNLTWEVRDGIRNHKSSGRPATLEGKLVQLSDKIAYINHDIDDAVRGGILKRRICHQNIPTYWDIPAKPG